MALRGPSGDYGHGQASNRESSSSKLPSLPQTSRALGALNNSTMVTPNTNRSVKLLNNASSELILGNSSGGENDTLVNYGLAFDLINISSIK